MNLDHELQRALRRKPAPPDLVDRVLARVDRPREVQRAGASRRRLAWWAVAAAAALAIAGGARYGQRQRAIEAERVQQEVRLALQITGEKLALVQRRLQQIGVEEGP